LKSLAALPSRTGLVILDLISDFAFAGKRCGVVVTRSTLHLGRNTSRRAARARAVRNSARKNEIIDGHPTTNNTWA